MRANQQVLPQVTLSIAYAAATGGPSPTAGVITTTTTISRQIQFGLKLLW